MKFGNLDAYQKRIASLEFPRSGVQFLEIDKKTQKKSDILNPHLPKIVVFLFYQTVFFLHLHRTVLSSMISYVPMFWIDSSEQCLEEKGTI